MHNLIYLLEDDESLAEGLSVILCDEGYEVKRFATGLEFKKCMQKTLPNMIILDYRLPDEDGISITKKLKNRPSTKHLPVMLISASQVNLKDKAKEVFAEAYLVKPFAISDFLFTIKRLVQ